METHIWILLQIVLTFTFIAVYTLAAVYAERKVSAFIQDRLGPMDVGPYGALQTLADIVKLILKEAIVPDKADKVLFFLAPLVIFVSVFAGFAAVPLSPDLMAAPMGVGLLYILGIIAIDIIGFLLAGWGSSNKYALMGAMRAVAQIISYEIPAAFALLSAVMMFGTLDLQEISFQQGIFSPTSFTIWGWLEGTHTGGFLSWAAVRYPHLLIAFAVYFISALAECNRTPFDIPEAESELVAGYHVEYAGPQFAIMFLAEYGKMLLVSLIAAILFFGGWNTFFPNVTIGGFSLPLANWTSGTPGYLSASLWGIFWLLLKSLALIFVQMWIRWTYPRLRADQLMSLCWKYLLPIGLGLFVVSGCIKLL